MVDITVKHEGAVQRCGESLCHSPTRGKLLQRAMALVGVKNARLWSDLARGLPLLIHLHVGHGHCDKLGVLVATKAWLGQGVNLVEG